MKDKYYSYGNGNIIASIDGAKIKITNKDDLGKIVDQFYTEDRIKVSDISYNSHDIKNAYLIIQNKKIPITDLIDKVYDSTNSDFVINGISFTHSSTIVYDKTNDDLWKLLHGDPKDGLEQVIKSKSDRLFFK